MDNTQKNLETASQKLAAARLAKRSSEDQQSEKLEVIEQPTTPQDPVKPNRPKIAALTVLLALAAGGGLAFLVEMIDQRIRRASEIYSDRRQPSGRFNPLHHDASKNWRGASDGIVMLGVSFSW